MRADEANSRYVTPESVLVSVLKLQQGNAFLHMHHMPFFMIGSSNRNNNVSLVSMQDCHELINEAFHFEPLKKKNYEKNAATWLDVSIFCHKACKNIFPTLMIYHWCVFVLPTINLLHANLKVII